MRNKRLWKNLMLATVCTVTLGTTSAPVFAAEVNVETGVSTEAETKASTPKAKAVTPTGEITGYNIDGATDGVITVTDDDISNNWFTTKVRVNLANVQSAYGYIFMDSNASLDDHGFSLDGNTTEYFDFTLDVPNAKERLIAAGGTLTFSGTFTLTDYTPATEEEIVLDTMDYSFTLKYDDGTTETPETPEAQGELTGIDFTGAVNGVVTLTDASFDKSGYAQLPIVVHGTPGLDVHSEGDLGMCNPQDMEGNGNYTGSFYVSKGELVKAGGTKVFNGTFIMQSGSPSVTDDTLDFSITVKYQSENSGQHHVEVLEGQSSLSKDEMGILVNINKDKDIIIKTSEGVYYSFGKGTMHVIDGKESYDLGLDLIQDFSQFPKTEGKELPFSKDEFGFYIKYNYSGELPGTAQITIPVDKKLAGQTLYYYEVMEDGTYRYTGQNAVVSEDGTYTVMQDHCSDYVALTKMLNTSTQTSPKTGDMAVVLPVLGTGLSSIGIAVAAIFRRRK